MSSDRAQRYLDALDSHAGGVEPEFWSIDASGPGLPPVSAIGYRDLPEPGMLLGFTYGLSLADHPAWRFGRPEVCVCVATDDPSFLLAATAMVQDLRGRCPFTYGDLLNFGGPLGPGSDLDGFVVFAPSVLDPDQARFDLGDDLPVGLVQLYPTHTVEREFIGEHGLEAFWQRDWDPYDVGRPPAV